MMSEPHTEATLAWYHRFFLYSCMESSFVVSQDPLVIKGKIG